MSHRRRKITQVPPTGPSDEALERFGRAIADGLRERFPELRLHRAAGASRAGRLTAR